MRVARLIVYQGDAGWVRKTIEMSLSQGIHQMGESRFITIIPIDFELTALALSAKDNERDSDGYFREADKEPEDE
jgi:hypothetical protein